MVFSSVMCLSCPQLPLAVYREIQAHLQQLSGVTVELLPPLPAPFNYQDSQIGGMQINLSDIVSTSDKEYLQEILDYYSQQFGAWQPYGE